jgi:sugar/nucleoside kinase (ribokinase family)
VIGLIKDERIAVMKYIVAGPTIINDVIFADGSTTRALLGGSIYCVAGIALWTGDCLYISNVGRDFNEYYGKWMDANKMSYDGLNFILPNTQYTTLTYEKDGLHDEVSIYSAEIEEQINTLDVITAKQIADHCGSDTKGIYIEASATSVIWDELHDIKERCSALIMWELPTSAAMNAQNHSHVMSVLKKVDMYSLNLPEAMSLFGKSSEAEVLKQISELGTPCFFRVGKKGSYMIVKGQAYFAPSVTVGPFVDATGCGNASTAAAMYGYCEGLSGERTARIANISAAYNLLQYGPYPSVSDSIREQSLGLLGKIV